MEKYFFYLEKIVILYKIICFKKKVNKVILKSKVSFNGGVQLNNCLNPVYNNYIEKDKTDVSA